VRARRSASFVRSWRSIVCPCAAVVEIDVDAGVDHERYAHAVRCVTERVDALGLSFSVHQCAVGVVIAVFEVAADRACFEEALGDLAGRQAVAGFDVRGDRHRDSSGDTTKRREGVVGVHLLVVGAPEAGRDRSRRGRDHLVPAAATARADAASHTLARSSGVPAKCRARSSSACSERSLTAPVNLGEAGSSTITVLRCRPPSAR
jgi:hypothetical protein